ncbi:MAG TPA: hypothetical protein VJR29_10625 [bacterium]|nr:hypothetical protein [bacterium]
MKRIATTMTSVIFGSLFLTSVAMAGLDYTRYNESFRAEKEAAPSPEEGKHFQHKSKYEREQPEGTLVPQSDSQRPREKPANKYDRRNWDSTQ